MASSSGFSAQTLSVLGALCEEPSQWQHGYALAKQTGLKSGTLYPILIRLADRGLVEACWQDEPAPGRPRRHLYRLTAAGPGPCRRGRCRRGPGQRGQAGAHQGAAEAGRPRRGRGGQTMNRLNQAAAAARRGVAWLLPAGRREWVAAVWAEAHEVPPGLARLAWRAGGAWVLAREALMPRRLARVALFAVAAGTAAWAAWPQPAVGHAAVSQFHVIATVLLLAGLPLLARRFFGPPTPSRAGRSLRVFCCAAVLALMPALAIVEAFANLTPARPAYRYVFCIAQGWSDVQGCTGELGRSTGGPDWAGEIPLLLMTIAYVGVILFLTSRRSRVTRDTLTVGIGLGLVFGLVMYVVAPLGLSHDATDPWLPGSTADPLVALAWILLFGGPAAAAVLAVWRGRGSGGAPLPRNVRIRQGLAAGVLANGTAALLVSALGFGTTALTLRSGSLLHWLNHGQHLTAIAAYRYEISASTDTNVYLFMLIWFPVIGLLMSALGVACSQARPGDRRTDPGPP